jgi:c-di-AMP phosphodiesterase-like protein
MLEPNMRFYFFLLIVFAVLTFFDENNNHIIAYVELGIVVLLYIYTKVTAHRRRNEIMQYIESVTSDLDTAAKNTLQNFPLPMAIFSLDDNVIISANQGFKKITGDKEHVFEKKITDEVPGFNSKWLLENKSESPAPVELDGKMYRVFGSVVRGEKRGGHHRYIATTYWMDETEHYRIATRSPNSKPVATL